MSEEESKSLLEAAALDEHEPERSWTVVLSSLRWSVSTESLSTGFVRDTLLKLESTELTLEEEVLVDLLIMQ